MIIEKKKKQKFDPYNEQHLIAANKFVTTGSWGPEGNNFEVEFPHTDVVSIVYKRISERFFNDRLKTVDIV